MLNIGYTLTEFKMLPYVGLNVVCFRLFIFFVGFLEVFFYYE